MREHADNENDDERAPLISTPPREHAAPPATPTARALPRDYLALHTVRLIGALHIAVYHTAPSAPLGPGAAWGASWVAFYFLLSGLGPAHSRLLQNQPLPPLQPSAVVLCKRLAAIYPTHVLGVLASAGVALVRNEPLRVGTLLLELLLIHAWLPAKWTLGYCADASCSNYVALAYNMPSWFISVIAGYWLLEPAVYRLGSRLCRERRPVLWASLLLVAWVLLWPWSRCPLTWDVTWWNAVDVLTYLHLYAYGAFLAVYLHTRVERGIPPFRWLATTATLLLCLVFGIDLKVTQIQPSRPLPTALARCEPSCGPPTEMRGSTARLSRPAAPRPKGRRDAHRPLDAQGRAHPAGL